MIAETTFNHRRVEHDGKVWHFDGKVWPPKGNRKGLLKVYRIYGDITDMAGFKEAVDALVTQFEFMQGHRHSEYA